MLPVSRSGVAEVQRSSEHGRLHAFLERSVPGAAHWVGGPGQEGFWNPRHILLTCGLAFAFRGDTTNSNLQNMEPVSETDEEQVPEDLGKLTVVDKARTGRVRVKAARENIHASMLLQPEQSQMYRFMRRRE